MTIPTVSFIGNSNTGKTTLLQSVISELKLRGFKVAVVKHTHHDFDMDHPKKDSWKFAEAGSDIVVVASTNRLAIIENLEYDLPLDEIQEKLAGKADILLTEGYKNAISKKIIVQRQSNLDTSLIKSDGEILATVELDYEINGKPVITPEMIIHLSDIIIAEILVREESDDQLIDDLLEKSALFHGGICPGQVLGVRMSLLGLKELGIGYPPPDKRLIVFVEIDRCAADAIQVVTGCRFGKRTMKHIDFGKLAATFLDTKTGKAVRVSTRQDSRQIAVSHEAEQQTKYEAQISTYKSIPNERLFEVQTVHTTVGKYDLPGPPKSRVICVGCKEEVNDGREVILSGKTLCRACAHQGCYYSMEDKPAATTGEHNYESSETGSPLPVSRSLL